MQSTIIVEQLGPSGSIFTWYEPTDNPFEWRHPLRNEFLEKRLWKTHLFSPNNILAQRSILAIVSFRILKMNNPTLLVMSSLFQTYQQTMISQIIRDKG